jgi:hypothetical protein
LLVNCRHPSSGGVRSPFKSTQKVLLLGNEVNGEKMDRA